MTTLVTDTQLPELFIDLHEIAPEIQLDLKYFTGDNFVGERISGYEQERCLLTRPAAMALKRVQQELAGFGLGLRIFDAYRPQRAVNHFIDWCDRDDECLTRERYFPDLQRSELFKLGYLVRHSSHSRGSTVDLTLIDLASGRELDMGTEFDFFGRESWFDCSTVSAAARANRLLLQTLMVQHGFVPFQQEWWHFTLQDEPYPDLCFDVPVA